MSGFIGLDPITVGWYTSVGVGVIGLLVAGAARLAGAIFHSVAPLPATAAQLQEEQLDKHPLFRHLPALKGRVAWRRIGTYPTPIHSVTATTPDGATIAFSVKREDLAHPDYGGNKLRTLQHQVRSTKLTVAFSKSSYILMAYGVFGTSSRRARRTSTPTRTRSFR